ncbi:hypothetical protein F4810DRAFT_706222 [Camillea tinctor]|nr:hypothetical protein F4810DRAFT_706222 [Camillea tinctor]
MNCNNPEIVLVLRLSRSSYFFRHPQNPSVAQETRSEVNRQEKTPNNFTMTPTSPRSILKKTRQSSPVSKRVAFHKGLAFDIVTGNQVYCGDDWIVVDEDEVKAEEELDVPSPSITGLFFGLVSVVIGPGLH